MRVALASWVLALAPFVAQGEPAMQITWQVQGDGGFSAPNLIRDASGEALALVCAEGQVGVTCLDLRGKRLWSYRLTPPITAAPSVADVDGNGSEDIVAADGAGDLVVLDGSGQLVWRAVLPGPVYSASCPAVADLDGDSRNEILVGDSTGHVSCLDAKGALRWRFQGDGTSMGPVLVADIYDLPGAEIIVTSHDGHIYALSASGEFLWDIYRDNDLFPNSNPILADVDGDKAPELYVGGGLHHFYRIDLATAAVVFEENVLQHVNRLDRRYGHGW